VNPQCLVATSEAVGVVEQAPSYQSAGDDGAPMLSSFRLAILRVVGLLRIYQLLVVTALHIPVFFIPNTCSSVQSPEQLDLYGNSSVKNENGCHVSWFLPSVVLVELVKLIIYVDWVLHILRNLQREE
jgi:hypothetical protein